MYVYNCIGNVCTYIYIYICNVYNCIDNVHNCIDDIYDCIDNVCN